MRGATLFSGIGAPEISAPDIEWVWHAEIEPFPSAVLAHHHGTPNLGDVTAHDFIERARRIGPIDLLVAGSPCQSFSVAGKRLGLDDPRGNLALVTLRICQQLQPRWLVFENVPGLLSSGAGDDFAAFLDEMEKCGYSGAWRILDAQYAGVAQRRRRVFAVGHLGGDWRPPAAVLFEPAGLCGDTPPSREAREETAPTVAGSLDTQCGGGKLTHQSAANGHIIVEGEDVQGTITTRTFTGIGARDVEEGAVRPMIAFGAKNSASQSLSASDAITPTLSTTKVPGVAFAQNSRDEVRLQGGDGQITGALAANSGSKQTTYVAGLSVRRLTPRECERLQGFPDDFTLIPYRHGKPAADGPRYKALGNSMAVPVIGWVLNRVRKFTELQP